MAFRRRRRVKKNKSFNWRVKKDEPFNSRGGRRM